MIISPNELLDQVRETLGLLCAPAEVQLDYLIKEGYPINELYEELYAISITFYERLEHHGLIDLEAEEAIGAVLRSIEDLIDTEAWQDQGLVRPPWETVREQARLARLAIAKFGTPIA